jgi:hypothetical protein
MFVASGTRLWIDKGVVIPYKTLLCRAVSGRNSAVECQLPKLDVTGSIPVARSKISPENPLSCNPHIFEILTETEKSFQNVPISKVLALFANPSRPIWE